VQIVMRPFEKFFTWTANGVGNFFGHFGDLSKAEAQITDLSNQLAQAQEQVRDLQNYQSENDDLRSLLDLKSTISGQTVAANVIAKDFSNWYSTFTIDKGTNDGVKIKTAVRTTSGLVGYISAVGTNWATVTTILNDSSSVSGSIVRTNDAVICQGELALQQNGQCRINYISSSSNIVSGDIVQTSGLGGIYPKGILIGTVGDISDSQQSVSQTAILIPAVNFEKTSVVLVEL